MKNKAENCKENKKKTLEESKERSKGEESEVVDGEELPRENDIEVGGREYFVYC